MDTVVTSACPHRDDSPEVAVVCDWLAANGIDEHLPERPTFLVQKEPHQNRIIYRAFKFDDDERGYDISKLADGYVTILQEDRVVPLLADVTEEVRAAFEALEARPGRFQAFLVEVNDRCVLSAKRDAYRKRLGLE